VVTHEIKVTEFRIWTVTFSRYFFIVVGKRSCPWFYGEYVTKGIFSRGLIKMAVNTKICRSNSIVDRHDRGLFIDHHCEHLPGIQEQHDPQHTEASCINHSTMRNCTIQLLAPGCSLTSSTLTT